MGKEWREGNVALAKYKNPFHMGYVSVQVHKICVCVCEMNDIFVTLKKLQSIN